MHFRPPCKHRGLPLDDGSPTIAELCNRAAEGEAHGTCHSRDDRRRTWPTASSNRWPAWPRSTCRSRRRPRCFAPGCAPAIRTYVACVGDRVVGTASLLVEQKFIHKGGKVGHIEDVAVHPDCRAPAASARALVRHGHRSRHSQLGCYKVILNCFERLAPFYAGARLSASTTWACASTCESTHACGSQARYTASVRRVTIRSHDTRITAHREALLPTLRAALDFAAAQCRAPRRASIPATRRCTPSAATGTARASAGRTGARASIPASSGCCTSTPATPTGATRPSATAGRWSRAASTAPSTTSASSSSRPTCAGIT